MNSILFYNLSSPVSDSKSLPFIKASLALGFETTVVTDEVNSAQQIGNNNYTLPISEIHKLKEIANRHSIDFAMTCNARLSPAIGKLSEDLGVLSFNQRAANVFSKKDIWWKFANDFGLPTLQQETPMSVADFSFEKWGDQRVIMKPSYSTGSVNTIIAENIVELRNILDKGLTCEVTGQSLTVEKLIQINQSQHWSGQFLIQQYLEYQEQLCLQIAVVGGKVHIAMISKILNRPYPEFESYGHIGPVSGHQVLASIWQAIIDELKIVNCNISPDVLYGKDGKYYIIDPNLNVGSEGLVDMVNQLRGIDYSMESLKAFMGLNYEFGRPNNFVGSFARDIFKANSVPILVDGLNFDQVLSQSPYRVRV